MDDIPVANSYYTKRHMDEGVIWYECRWVQSVGRHPEFRGGIEHSIAWQNLDDSRLERTHYSSPEAWASWAEDTEVALMGTPSPADFGD